MIFSRNKLPELSLQNPVFKDDQEIPRITGITPIETVRSEIYDWEQEEKLAPVIGRIGLSEEVAASYTGPKVNVLQEQPGL